MYLMSNIYIYVTQQDYYELNEYIENISYLVQSLFDVLERERERERERGERERVFLERDRHTEIWEVQCVGKEDNMMTTEIFILKRGRVDKSEWISVYAAHHSRERTLELFLVQYSHTLLCR